MGITFPNETAEYRQARNQLLAEEIELRRATEAAAEARRALPPGGEIHEDYLFERLDQDGNPEIVPMSALFSPGKDTLVIYSFMFGPNREKPCPGCTAFLQTLEGGAGQINQRVNFVVAARSPIQRLAQNARERGWQNLRFVSSGRSTYNLDYFGSDETGEDMPILNVFHKDGDTIRHFWTDELDEARSEDFGPVTVLEFPYQFLSLTPEGKPFEM